MTPKFNGEASDLHIDTSSKEEEECLLKDKERERENLSNEISRDRKNSILGMGLMVINIFIFTLNNAISKRIFAINPSLSPLEIFTFGTMGQLFFNQAFKLFSFSNKTANSDGGDGSLRGIPRKDLLILSIRLALGYPAWLLMTYSMLYIPIGLMQTVHNV